MSATAWISALFPIVSTVLKNLEQNKKALERTDIRDALLQLLHLLREWHHAAKYTNHILLDWLEKGKPVYYEPLVLAVKEQQKAEVKPVLHISGYASPYHLDPQEGRDKKDLLYSLQYLFNLCGWSRSRKVTEPC